MEILTDGVDELSCSELKAADRRRSNFRFLKERNEAEGGKKKFKTLTASRYGWIVLDCFETVHLAKSEGPGFDTCRD